MDDTGQKYGLLEQRFNELQYGRKRDSDFPWDWVGFAAIVLGIPAIFIAMFVFVPSYDERYGVQIGPTYGAKVLCRSHGGVRAMDTGKYASDSVICMDGSTHDAYSVRKCAGEPSHIGKRRCPNVK